MPVEITISEKKYKLYTSEIVDTEGKTHTMGKFDEKTPNGYTEADDLPEQLYDKKLGVDVPVKLREKPRNFWAGIEYQYTADQNAKLKALKDAKELAQKNAESKAQDKHDRKVAADAQEKYKTDIIAGKFPEDFEKIVKSNPQRAQTAINDAFAQIQKKQGK